MSDVVPNENQNLPPEMDDHMSDVGAAMDLTGGTNSPMNVSTPPPQLVPKSHSKGLDLDENLIKQKQEIDARSVYVGNVDYSVTPLELQQHFSAAGIVERVTILNNKITGQPRGFAYVEFANTESVENAVGTLDGSELRDRQLKVTAKRTNIPGVNARGRGRGRGFGGRGRARGFRARGPRGRGASRGTDRFTPY